MLVFKPINSTTDEVISPVAFLVYIFLLCIIWSAVARTHILLKKLHDTGVFGSKSSALIL